MPTTITIQTASDSLTITGDGVYTGPTYDRFEGWYGVQAEDTGFDAKPSAPGSFAPGQVFPGARAVSIEGQYFGSSVADGIAMGERLAGLFNQGLPVKVTVADDLRSSSRTAYILSVGLPKMIYEQFSFSIDMKADDPRRYADTVTQSTGLALPGAGLDYGLVDQTQGLDYGPVDQSGGLDYGSTSSDGRISIANPGNAESVTTFVVGSGTAPNGFRIVNVDTGESLYYIGTVTSGMKVTLDPYTEQVYINDTNPAGRFLPSPDWWTIPPKGKVTVQFLADGGSANLQLSAVTATALY